MNAILQAPIPKRSSNCSHHQELFIPGQSYITYLDFEEESWKRADFCLKCWESLKHDLHYQEGSFWRGRIPLSLAKSKKFQKDEKALKFLRELIISENEMDLKISYILSLYLERRKSIQKREEKKNKKSSSIYYELEETGELFVIPIFFLTSKEIDSISELLIAKFNDE